MLDLLIIYLAKVGYIRHYTHECAETGKLWTEFLSFWNQTTKKSECSQCLHTCGKWKNCYTSLVQRFTLIERGRRWLVDDGSLQYGTTFRFTPWFWYYLYWNFCNIFQICIIWKLTNRFCSFWAFFRWTAKIRQAL